MAATLVSFVLCLIYLAFLPFHAWALAVLVGASALAVMLLGRPGDAVTAGITTAVIMVVAAVSPRRHALHARVFRVQAASHHRQHPPPPLLTSRLNPCYPEFPMTRKLGPR
jgi:hypothetical protein